MEEQIQILFKGLRRNISEKQYSKIRHFPYAPASSRSQDQTFIVKETEEHPEQVVAELEENLSQIKNQISKISMENSLMAREIKREQKISRVMPKKKLTKQQCTQKQFEKYKQFLLALEVIKLEQELETKQQICKQLTSKSKHNFEEEFNNLLLLKSLKLETILKMIKSTNNQAYIMKIKGDLKQKIEIISQQSQKLNGKLKNIRKQKSILSRCLSDLEIVLKQSCSKVKEIENKKLEKDPSEFISTKGGEMKNLHELQDQIYKLRNQNIVKEKQIRQKMEDIIIRKISLRNQLQKYEDNKFYLNDYMIKSR